MPVKDRFLSLGLKCEPRFERLNCCGPTVVRFKDRNYCRECLLERVQNDPEFTAEVIVHLLLR